MQKSTSYTVYVLRSLKDHKLYIGMTSDFERRINEHNSGKTFSTRHRRPFVLVYSEQVPSGSEARRREQFLKSGPGHRFLEQVIASKTA
ncbi:MAG: GIY-YIG nuclease family protein [Bacteroidetes bacterium]|nr:GIY-YIG nuclease family protein [Bacteroidota bacterium]MCW5896220.1 GIY-YIG nuclease family protein [Bacteroidota bacterium]